MLESDAMSNAGGKDTEDRVGLCSRCRHAHVIRSHKGSTFYMCGLAATDPRFVKYPALPVRSCDGYEDEEPSRPGGER